LVKNGEKKKKQSKYQNDNQSSEQESIQNFLNIVNIKHTSENVHVKHNCGVIYPTLYTIQNTDFRLSRWLTDVNSVLGMLHRVDVGDVADVSEVHAALIFRVKV
jgi:hypothetical protein